MRNRVRPAALVAGALALLLVPLAAAAPPDLGPLTPSTVEATGPGGATVSYSVGVSDDTDPPPVANCSPAPGSLFPLGTTTVDCNATDIDGESSSQSFGLTVQDTTPPTLGAMTNETAVASGPSGAAVSYTTPGATDLVDGSPSVNCSPGSGATFPIGTTSVNCTATDGSGNSDSGSFTVTVNDTTDPVLTVPGDIVAEATGPGGAAVSFSASATDWSSFTLTCAPSSGSTFPLGTTTVTCTATDTGSNSTSGTFQVTVRDTTAPSLTPPATVFAEATSLAGATVSYPAPAVADAADTSPTVSCSPASGSTFAFGSTTVNCTATDNANNSSSGSFGVVVQDTTAPALSAPGAIVVEANGSSGSAVVYAVAASDLGAPLLPSAISCAPASGTLFPLGATTVSCSAGDGAGNVAAASFPVTVQDTTPPTIIAADITVAATTVTGIASTDAAMAAYLRSLTATDLVSSSVVVVTDAPAVFPVGVTPLVVRAIDGAGNAGDRTVRVTVLPKGSVAPPPPDLDPPADVTRVRATGGDHRVTLGWVTPTTDVAAVEVRMSVTGDIAGERLVYRGKGAQTIVRGLRNDVQHRFVVVTVDAAGNRSRGVVAVAVPKALLLAFPKPGAKVATPPLLRWVPVAGASYFNVQVYRGKAKVLSAWPSPARLQLKRSWTYNRVKRTLAPGTYTWYVWPGLGARSETRYGPLLGKSTFVVVKPKQ